VADDDRASLAEAMRLAQSGTVLVAPMLGLGAIGYFLDRRFGTGPWLMVAGLLLGMAGGFVNFLKMVTRKDRAGGPGKSDAPKGGPRA
jgi:F0F1-type ATP synthase assembly protein I